MAYDCTLWEGVGNWHYYGTCAFLKAWDCTGNDSGIKTISSRPPCTFDHQQGPSAKQSHARIRIVWTRLVCSEQDGVYNRRFFAGNRRMY